MCSSLTEDIYHQIVIIIENLHDHKKCAQIKALTIYGSNF